MTTLRTGLLRAAITATITATITMATALGGVALPATANAATAPLPAAAPSSCPDADTAVHDYAWFSRRYPGNGLGALFALADSQERAQHAVACLVDAERVAAGLHPLRWSDRLRDAARGYASAAAARKWWTDGADWHVDPRTPRTFPDQDRERSAQVDTRIREQTPCSTYVGDGHQLLRDAENLYQGWGGGDGGPASPRAAVAWWMQSPPHRAAILDPATTATGVGVQGGYADPAHATADPAGIFVQHFATCS